MYVNRKNRLGSYNGTSPSQWLLGRTRNPLIDASEASPMLTRNSAFEEHFTRRTVAAQQFHAADAKNILHMAATARTEVRRLKPGLRAWQIYSQSSCEFSAELFSRIFRSGRAQFLNPNLRLACLLVQWLY